jgi:hypothetical protein
MPSETRLLLEHMRERIPAFYTTHDAGEWFAVSQLHEGRMGENFARRDDAHRFLLWLAGDPFPKNWSIMRITNMTAEIDCRQGYSAILRIQAAKAAFPKRFADGKPTLEAYAY